MISRMVCFSIYIKAPNELRGPSGLQIRVLHGSCLKLYDMNHVAGGVSPEPTNCIAPRLHISSSLDLHHMSTQPPWFFSKHYDPCRKRIQLTTAFFNFVPCHPELNQSGGWFYLSVWERFFLSFLFCNLISGFAN